VDWYEAWAELSGEQVRLQVFSMRSIVGELFEAWPHGPVLSSLYHEFKSNGVDPIHDYASEIDPVTGEEKRLMVALSNKPFFEIFEPVWQKYKNYSGLYLSKLTHAPNTPWEKARMRRDPYLSNDEIREYFRKLVVH
jgi:uncharacterized phage-associated protein